MTPEEAKALIKTLEKTAEVIVALRKQVKTLNERVETLENEVLSLQVKELSREMKGHRE